MTTDDLRALLSRLGLTQARAAVLCGVDERTLRRWCCGERDIPPPAQRLLLACERFPAVLRWLLR